MGPFLEPVDLPLRLILAEAAIPIEHGLLHGGKRG
jgi:hypothetical protein